jgi:ferrous iron transport protein A
MAEQFDIGALAPGETGMIVAIDPAGDDPAGAERLRQLGFDEGVDVELLHRAPFGGDPLAVRVGNMVVALRRRLAALVLLDVSDGAGRP